jgi:hypothetical protein
MFKIVFSVTFTLPLICFVAKHNVKLC